MERSSCSNANPHAPASHHGRRARTRRAGVKLWMVSSVVVLVPLWYAVRPLLHSPRPALTGAAAAAPAATATCRTGRSWWAAPDGSADADGTLERPLDLATALSSRSPARPCDTIWLRGGQYRGAFVSELRGQETAPIVVRQAPNERATLDGAPSADPVLTARGEHAWFWGFEVTSSDPDRVSGETGPWPTDLRRGGIAVRGSELKFINLVVHDLTRGFSIDSSALNTEVYGSLVYYNGWQAADGGTNGHGIDTHNRAGRRLFADNIVFNQFSHGILAYGSAENPVDNIGLEGNILFNNGVLGRNGPERDVLIGGGSIAQNPVLRANLTYGGAQTVVGHGAGCRGARIEGNLLVAPFLLGPCDAVIKGNTVHGTGGPLAAAHRDNAYRGEPPAGVVVTVRPNRYEPGRAHVAIYNWDRRPAVDVDLSAAALAPGTAYEVRDAQNFFGRPVVKGTFSPDSPAVSIPLTGLSVAPPVGEGLRAPAHTAPEFATLVVVPVGAPAADRR
jgi:hypothetical protein